MKCCISVIWITCLASFTAAPVANAAPLINGGFETGDLTGWTASPGASGSVSVQSSVSALGNGPGDPGYPGGGDWLPTQGSFFGYVVAGEENAYTLLSQVFGASLGDTLSFDVFFDAGDYLPYNDDGFVNLVNVDTLVTTPLYARSVFDVGDYGADGWSSITHSFVASGNYRLEVGVRNINDSGIESSIGIDNIVHDSALTNVPEPASMLTWGVLTGVGLAYGAWKRRRMTKAYPRPARLGIATSGT